MQRLKLYFIFSRSSNNARFILALSSLIVFSNFSAHGQLMDSYVPTPQGQEFRCGPSEDCKKYSLQHQQLCGCVSGSVPYTTVPYRVEQE